MPLSVPQKSICDSDARFRVAVTGRRFGKTHLCIREFPTEKIDYCSGLGWNKCYGTKPMTLEVWFQDKNGLEEYEDNWMEIEVNFCPFCGLKSEEKD